MILIKEDRSGLMYKAMEMFEAKTPIDEVRSYLETFVGYKSNDEQVEAFVNAMDVPGRPPVYAESVKRIKAWFANKPDVFQPDDNYIHAFLFTQKFDEELAKKKMMEYFRIRGTDTQLFGHRDTCSPESRRFRDSAFIVVSDEFTDKFYMVIIGGLKKNRPPDEFELLDGVREMLNLSDILIRTSVSLGQIIIFDLAGLRLHDILKFSVGLIRKCIYTLVQGGMPIRIKGIHCINVNPIGVRVLRVVKRFLKKKIADRLFFHSSVTSLYDHVPLKCLPKDYGGQKGTIEELNKRLDPGVKVNFKFGYRGKECWESLKTDYEERC